MALHLQRILSFAVYFYMLLTWISCFISSVTGHQVMGSHPVQVKEGDDVILPCHIQPPLDVTDMTVKWSRPDLKPPYVHVLQDGRVKNGVNPLYRRRTSLFHEELQHGNISLKLFKVQLSDQGTYRCSVPHLSSSTDIQLRVVQQELIYIPSQGVLRLVPNISSVPEPITSILWKHGANKAAEWDQVIGPEVDYYGPFRNRSALDKTTGQLLINNMTTADTGEYPLEINGRVHSKTYVVKVINKVPKPTLDIKDPCDSTSISCTVFCVGDISESGPVSYQWRNHTGEWTGPDSTQNTIYNQEEFNTVKTLSCGIKNPVSEEQSDARTNPFYKEGGSTGAVIAGIVIPLIIILVAAGLRCYWKKQHPGRYGHVKIALTGWFGRRGPGDTDIERGGPADEDGIAGEQNALRPEGGPAGGPADEDEQTAQRPEGHQRDQEDAGLPVPNVLTDPRGVNGEPTERAKEEMEDGM